MGTTWVFHNRKLVRVNLQVIVVAIVDELMMEDMREVFEVEIRTMEVCIVNSASESESIKVMEM